MVPEAALARAAACLHADDRAGALHALLAAWGALRHPRIATLVDFVSADLTGAAPPIKGKTVAARVAAWQALAAARDPLVLGRLLATPWPGTLQKAELVLEPLCAWPDDPRIAMALGRLVEAYPFDSWSASAFYQRLLPVLARLGDVRVVPLLEHAVATQRSVAHLRDVRPQLVAVLAALERAREPALDAPTERALALAEAPYRERLTAQAAAARGAAEHLAAIYADPNDLAARAVYGDWLGERGNPRGELISLQLARSAGGVSDAAIARERKLLDEHGTTWAGALDPWLVGDDRMFVNGFLAGGRLRWRYQYGHDFTVDRMLEAPGWALVRRLAAVDDGMLLRTLIDRVEMRSLCEIVASYDTIIALATGPERPALTAIHWHSPRGAPAPLDTLATCAALPALREIGFFAPNVDEHVAWLTAAPVVERIARLVLGECQPRYLEAAGLRGGALREIELDLQPVGHAHAGWRFVLARDAAPGPFTRFTARPRGGPHDLAALASVLSRLPATLRELVITSPKKLVLPKAERAELVAALARFEGLERCELPWPELSVGGALPVTREHDDGPHITMHVTGEPLFTPEKVGAVWACVTRGLGLAYDSFEVGAKWRPLGDDPLARIEKWASNRRCYEIAIFRDGTRGRLWITRPQYGGTWATTTLLAPIGRHSAEELVTWWLGFLELGAFEVGALDDASETRPWHVFDLGDLACGVRGAWLVYFGPAQQALLPASEVAALATHPQLDGLFVRATTQGVVVGLARTPSEVTTERLAACATGLRAILAAQLVARFGYVLAERVTATLGTLAGSIGLRLVTDPETPFTLRFASADDERRITFEVRNLYHAPRLSSHLYGPAASGGSWVLVLAHGLPAASRDEVDAALAHVATMVRDHGAKLVAEPPASGEPS